LKGIPAQWIKEAIRRGNSMHLMNADYKFFASAIVAGSIPIALGVALAIKQRSGSEQVWCFCGDMAGETGIFHECSKYARRNNLPIHFVIEDNGLSTTTPTYEAWGLEVGDENTEMYVYIRGCPHINVSEWVEFK
jgi:pyruvate dehydrogenase E1 component alpha subunit